MDFQHGKKPSNPVRIGDTASMQSLSAAFFNQKQVTIINIKRSSCDANPQAKSEVDLNKIFPPNHLPNKISRNSYEDKKSLRIRVPKGTSCMVVSDRKLNQKYQTNNHTKAAALYLLLKSLTRSGVIHDWRFQQIEIAQMFGVTTRTIRKYLQLAQEHGYLTHDNFTDKIKLHSYAQFCERLGVKFSGFQIIEVQRTAVRHLPVLLYGIEVKENKEAQHYYTLKKILLNPPLATALKDELKCDERDLQQQLKRAQLSSFLRRSKGDHLHVVNADDNRNLATIRRAWGMKDRRSAAYMKTKLMVCGAAAIEHRRIASTCGQWTKVYYTSFNRNTGQRTTFLPDEISLNRSIYQ